MMKKYFDDIVSGIDNAISENPANRSPRKLFAREVSLLGSKLYDDARKKAWCGIVVPFDILSAMNVTSCFVEFVGAILSSSGFGGNFIERAEQYGYASDTCAYHRSVMGAALSDLMPVPDILIGSTCPCAGGLAVMENLANHFGKKLFVLNIPQEETKGSIRYLADQLEDMTEFVARHTGETPDEDAFRLAIQRSNRMTEILREIYRLAAHVPSPVNGKLLANFGIVMPLFMGTEVGNEIAETFRKYFADCVKENRSGVPDEKIRLMWIQNRIQFQNPVVELLEKDYGAAIVIDELNTVFWDEIDPDDPFPGIAKRIIRNPFNGFGNRRMEALKQLAEEYRIHGAINPCHWGCRQGAGMRGLLETSLKGIGVSVLNLEIDCVDQRNFSEGQVRTRIEAFMEMLESKPSPWEQAA